MNIFFILYKNKTYTKLFEKKFILLIFLLMQVDLPNRWDSIQKLYSRSSSIANPEFEPSKTPVS